MEDRKIVDEVEASLEDVLDPEVGLDIVNLGLVYKIENKPHVLSLTLTLTSPACPLSDVIEEQIINALHWVGKPIEFRWAFQPLWSPAFMTDEGRQQLLAIGGHIPRY